VTTAFGMLAQLCGLTQREAAELLGVRPDTVKAWWRGRRRAPRAVLEQLAQLAETIDRAAAEAGAETDRLIEEGPGAPDLLELGVARDDAEARTLGWPCVGAHEAVLARVAAAAIRTGLDIAVVPRASTPATATAARAHRKRTGAGSDPGY